MSKHYKVECGDFVVTYSTLEKAVYHAKRIGLARCEIARVIDPSGKCVKEF